MKIIIFFPFLIVEIFYLKVILGGKRYMAQDKIEILRKRNSNLQAEIEKLKEQLEIEKKSSENISTTLRDLENLRNEWEKELQAIKEQREQYTELICNLKSLQKVKNVLEE